MLKPNTHAKFINCLKNEWDKCGLKDFSILQTDVGKQQGITLQGVLEPHYKLHPNYFINATLQTGLSESKSIFFVLNAVVPSSLPLSSSLSNLCLFSQQISPLLSPNYLTIDIDSEQFLLKQSMLISTTLPIKTQSFITTAKQVIPLITECTEQITKPSIKQKDVICISHCMLEQYFNIMQESANAH